MVGDGEGVCVIPAHLANEIAAETWEQTAYEDFVTEKVREGRSIVGLYPPTDETLKTDFAAWRKAARLDEQICGVGTQRNRSMQPRRIDRLRKTGAAGGTQPPD